MQKLHLLVLDWVIVRGVISIELWWTEQVSPPPWLPRWEGATGSTAKSGIKRIIVKNTNEVGPERENQFQRAASLNVHQPTLAGKL